ncbi:UNVERIFIED_CONTAM: hypothetical protein K2H54_022602 [Gekko kuhli]
MVCLFFLFLLQCISGFKVAAIAKPRLNLIGRVLHICLLQDCSLFANINHDRGEGLAKIVCGFHMVWKERLNVGVSVWAEVASVFASYVWGFASLGGTTRGERVLV